MYNPDGVEGYTHTQSNSLSFINRLAEKTGLEQGGIETSFIPAAALPRGSICITITHTIIQQHGKALTDASYFINHSLPS